VLYSQRFFPGIEVKIKGNIITVNGCDKEAVGQVIGRAQLEATDLDNTPAQQLTYTLTAVPVNGTLKKESVVLTTTAPNNTFTQQDINDNKIKYSHNGSETILDSFKFTVSDGAGGSIAGNAFSLTVILQNNAPVLTINVLTAERISDTDKKNIAVGIKIKVSATDAENGNLTYSASNLPSGAKFILAAQTFIWVPKRENIGKEYRITFKVEDSGTPKASASEVVVIKVVSRYN